MECSHAVLIEHTWEDEEAEATERRVRQENEIVIEASMGASHSVSVCQE